MKSKLSPLALLLVLGLAVAPAQQPAADDPREQALAYLDNDQATEATATLAAAAAKNPGERILGAMLYAAVRDHVWHSLQLQAIPLEGAVSAITFTSDGKLLAGGSEGGEVAIAATDGATEPKRLPRKAEGGVIGLAFSADGQRLAVVAKSGAVAVWDVAAMKPLFEPPASGSAAVAFDAGGPSNLIAFATAKGAVEIIDLKELKALAPIQVPGGIVTAIGFSRSGEKISAAGTDFRARVWKARTGESLGAGVAHKSNIRSIDFSYDDRYVLTGGDDGVALLSNPDEGVAVLPPMKCGAQIKKAIASYGGTLFATVLEDKSVLLWDAFTGEKQPSVFREESEINDFAWGHSGLRAATVMEDGRVSLWTTRTGDRRGEQIRQGSPVRIALTSPPESRFLATGTADGKLRLWRTDAGASLPTIRNHAARARTAFYSRDGQHLVTASEDHTALHWISGEIRPHGPALKHKGNVTCAVFDPAGKQILTTDESGAAQVWDADTGALKGEPFQHPDAVHWGDFHADGKRFVAVSGPIAYIWSTDNHTKPLATCHHSGVLTSARFSRDGKWLITGSSDGTVRVWDANTYAPAGEAIDRKFPVLCVRFSMDSARFVVTGEDNQAAVYDTATRQIIGTPILTTGPVFSAAFTDDGNYLVLASLLLDNLQFFEVATGRPGGTGIRIGAQALCVDHLHADRVVAVACDDGTVRSFETPFVNQDVPAWFPEYTEGLIGLRQTGPEKFEPVEKTFAQVQSMVPAAGAGANEDFPRLARWKLDHTTERHGMPRFVSTLASIIDRRVEERSVDALMECYEAISVDPLVLAALSLYLPNPRQGEYIADMSLKIPNTTPLSRSFAASTLVNAGRSSEARVIAEQAVAEAPNDVRVLRRVAKLEARLSNTAAAIEYFERALKLQPDNPETYRAYGWMLYNSQQYAKAAEKFKQAEVYAGDLVEDFIAGLCLSARGLGDKAGAQAAYARLVALDPEWKKASYLTALKGWTQQELQELEQVRQIAIGNR